MSESATGKYAFPLGNPVDGGYDGMTLRQWYAGQALMSGMGSPNTVQTAQWCFLMADAMIAAGEQS